jgi:heat shock protein HslJ
MSASTRRLFLSALTLLAAAALALAACGSDDTQTGGAETAAGADTDGGSAGAAGGGATRPWMAGDWALLSATRDGQPLTVPDEPTIDLAVAGPDRIEGNLGCNSFSGTISAPFDGDRDGGSLTLSGLTQSEMACDRLEFELAYTELLTSVTEWELAPPSGLVLRGDGVELVYQASPPAAEVRLEGTAWTFDTVFSGEGVERAASTVRADKPPVTATVGDGLITLTSADCGPIDVAITYESGAGGSFLPATPAATAGCDDPDSNLEVAFAGVVAATGYQVVDGRLTLIGLPGETVSFTSIAA